MVHNGVKLIECPRDAWQGLKRQIPTELKARYLLALIGAGFKHIDAVSFVSPKAVPQMADSEKVLEQIDVPGDVEIIGIVVNEKGAERAITNKVVATLGFPYSISETFLSKNQNQTLEDGYEVLQSVKAKADKAGLGMVAYISMAFGNLYGDPWNEDEVCQAVGKLAGIGIRSISLADTVGVAAPDLIRRVIESVMSQYPGYDIGVHLHSAPGGAAAKVLVAYDAGCRRFDSAIGGLGGCPFAQDTLVGNIPTESVIAALQQRGVELPISKSLAEVLAVNSLIAANYS
ncbi:MAG: hydroxymethylglutaryl-CoA lyase [Verrucomicrobia bacterium]|nr:MAG: hydroxymethylglutaryl-CoA lyase [Verrucomicrobiota bacterium]PYL67671.1 MAG: hydroxymethylglutaryl-CoA lyase [Verrucomicrobiota bacterium]